MASTIDTTISELPDARVRIAVEIPAEEFEGRLDQQARAMGRKLKISGFRRGKVPLEIVRQRIGRDALAEEAISAALHGWYASAIEQAGVISIGDPEFAMGTVPAPGSPYSFAFEVGVLPPAQLGDYKGLEVGVREPEVADEQIDQEVAALREHFARLEEADRPAEMGDFVVVDMQASVAGKRLPDGRARDELVELGSGRLVEDLEARLVGAAAGDSRSAELVFPAEHPDRRLRGRSVRFDAQVKQVKSKNLPEVDEDFAADAGFDTLAELRDEIRGRLLAGQRREIEGELREAALDAAVERASVRLPAEHVAARARELLGRSIRRMASQGISPEVYMRLAGKSEQEMLADLAQPAEHSLRREAVLTAIVQAEGTAPDDAELARELARVSEQGEADVELDMLASGDASAEELDGGAEVDDEDAGDEAAAGESGAVAGGAAPERSAREAGTDGASLLERLRASGRLEELREQFAGRRALQLLADSARPIPLEQAQARAQIWTPEAAESAASAAVPLSPEGGAQAQGGGGIWTPGS